jgi:type IV secretion system protein TrbJ
MNRRAVVASSALVAFAFSRPAVAQLAVFDASDVAQTTATAVATAKTVLNTLQQIELMHQQIQNQLQTLKGLDVRTYSGLQALLGNGKLTYQMIRSDVDSLGFQVQDVNRDFDTLFPRNKTNWSTVRYADYDGYYGRWNAEITASSKSAGRAQAAIVVVEKNNQAVADILSQAASATGEVRQLQLVNQQLALIHAELGALVQNLATTGRITGDMAAASAGEKMLTREAKLRRRAGYTNRGQPPRALTRMP